MGVKAPGHHFGRYPVRERHELVARKPQTLRAQHLEQRRFAFLQGVAVGCSVSSRAASIIWPVASSRASRIPDSS
jgi:hypothetical protein